MDGRIQMYTVMYDPCQFRSLLKLRMDLARRKPLDALHCFEPTAPESCSGDR